MSALLGIDLYTSGDSEISDEEDDGYTAKFGESAPPGVGASALGIPHHRLPSSTDYSSAEYNKQPVVHLAPLVDYGADEDHDVHRDSTSSFFDDSVPMVQEDHDSSHENKDGSGGEDGSGTDEVIDTPSYLSKYTVTLPPEPTGKCSKALQDKVIQVLEKKRLVGISQTTSIMKRKDFRNPSIYDKLVQFLNLDEFGTNYPEELFNPKEWTEDSHYENLNKAQRQWHETKEKAKLTRNQVEFVSGGLPVKRPSTVASTTTATATNAVEAKRQRKSKWDILQDPTSSKGASPEPLKVGAQALANAAQLNVELNKLTNK